MITDQEKLSIITKVRNEIAEGLRREELRRFELDLRLTLAALSDEQKVVILDQEIASKSERVVEITNVPDTI